MSSEPRGYFLSELLTTEFPEGQFLIQEGVLPKQGIMVIGGPPKAYKSFLLSTIIYHLTTGTHLFGAFRKSHGRADAAMLVPRPCRVLLLEQEIGAPHLKNRFQPLVDALAPQQRALFINNLAIYSCDFELQLDTDPGRSKLQRLLDQYHPDVVCFDPLVEFHTRDENDTQQMALIFRGLDRLRQRYGFATIINHHTGKPSATSPREGPDLLRGNSVIFGKGDCYIMLKPINRHAGLIQLDFTIRQGRPIDSMTVMLDWQDLRAKFHEWGAGGKLKGTLPSGLNNLNN